MFQGPGMVGDVGGVGLTLVNRCLTFLRCIYRFLCDVYTVLCTASRPVMCAFRLLWFLSGLCHDVILDFIRFANIVGEILEVIAIGVCDFLCQVKRFLDNL